MCATTQATLKLDATGLARGDSRYWLRNIDNVRLYRTRRWHLVSFCSLSGTTQRETPPDKPAAFFCWK
jgi:hypothetical protein